MKKQKFYTAEEQQKEFDLLSQRIRTDKIKEVKVIPRLTVEFYSEENQLPIHREYRHYVVELEFCNGFAFQYKAPNRKYFEEIKCRIYDAFRKHKNLLAIES